MSATILSRRSETDRLMWTAGVIAGASLPHWATLPIWAPILLCACIGWRLAGDLFRWPLPNMVVRVALALIAFAAVLGRYHTLNGVEAGSALLVVMVALKFLETRTNRDQLVLIIISYFLLFAGLLGQRSILIVLYLIGFVWLTTIGLMQLGRRGPLLGSWATARFSGRLLLQALPIMLVLFVFFPRLPGPLWAIPGANTSGRSGLSDTMSPGDITELGLSDEIAFRVEFFDRPPGPGQLYWRGPVLSNFNGRTWSSNGVELRGPIEDTLEFEGEPIDYRVMLEPHGRRWVFALDMPAEWPDDERILMESHYQLIRFARIRSRQDYSMRSYPVYRAAEPLSDAQRNVYLHLPENNNPRSRELAQQWRDNSATQRDIIQSALQIFRDETFYYTLTPPPLNAHPADEFLFETREGFCEHYASAFTVLMRAAGIPARVVTGYQGGELNPLGQYYIIYQSNAHAWTEVWLEDEGWVRIDPTAAVAPDRIRYGLSGGTLAGERAGASVFRRLPWLRDMALAWDAANTYWNDWVLDFGPEIQNALLRSLGMSRPHWSKLIGLGITILVTLLGALSIYLAWIYRIGRRNDPAARYFARFGRKLGRARVAPRRPAEGPLDYGSRAAQAIPSASERIEEITEAYVKARYEPDDGRDQLERLKQLVKGFNPGPAV
jgi:transglutaminase-like putative cysteine protease